MIRNADFECVHIPINDGRWADVLARGLKRTEKWRGTKSQFVARPEQDAWGLLGEECFGDWLYEQGRIYITQPWDSTGKGGDDWDFKLGNGETIDVKTRCSNWWRPDLWQYEVMLYEAEAYGQGKQWYKPIDYYVFAVWLPKHKKLTLLGWTTKQQFLDSPSYRKVLPGNHIFGGKTNNDVAKRIVHLNMVKDLNTMASLFAREEVEA